MTECPAGSPPLSALQASLTAIRANLESRTRGNLEIMNRMWHINILKLLFISQTAYSYYLCVFLMRVHNYLHIAQAIGHFAVKLHSKGLVIQKQQEVPESQPGAVAS